MSREAELSGVGSIAARFAFTLAFVADFAVVLGLRGELVRDAVLVFGFALPGVRARPAGPFMMTAARRGGS